jgi:hypothetical protein
MFLNWETRDKTVEAVKAVTCLLGDRLNCRLAGIGFTAEHWLHDASWRVFGLVLNNRGKPLSCDKELEIIVRTELELAQKLLFSLLGSGVPFDLRVAIYDGAEHYRVYMSIDEKYKGATV